MWIQTQFVPIPLVAFTTPDFDFMAEDLVLNVRELTPKQIKFETITNIRDPELEKGRWARLKRRKYTYHIMHDWIMGVWLMITHYNVLSVLWTHVGKLTEPGTEPIEMENWVRMYMKGITADIKGIKWYYNKKTGIREEGWYIQLIRPDFLIFPPVKACQSFLLHEASIDLTIWCLNFFIFVSKSDRGLADVKIYGSRGMEVWLDIKPTLPVATQEKPVAHTLGMGA